MLRLTNTLAPLWDDTFQQQSAADDLEHRRRLTALIDNASQAPQVPIPEHLHGGGAEQVRTVTRDDINRLRMGNAIALATRSLLDSGASNQRLPLASTGGRCLAGSLSVRRSLMAQALGGTSAAATLAVLARAGACGEHAAVALELAKALDLEVALCVNQDDHSAIVMQPALGERAVVIDAWTTFPGSCLLADSGFDATHLVAQPQLEPATSAPFNLVSVDTLRSGLEQELGAQPMTQAILTERVEQELAGNTDGYSPRQLNSMAANLLLHDAANLISSAPSRDMTVSDAAAAPDATGNSPTSALASDVSSSALRQRAYRTTDQMLSVVQQIARYRAISSTDRCAHYSETVRLQAPLPDQHRVDIDVALSASARPTVRDVRLPSNNILYRTASGTTFSTTTAPQAIIDEAAGSVNAANTLDFPDRFVMTDAQRVDYWLSQLKLQVCTGIPPSPIAISAKKTLIGLVDKDLAKLPVTGQRDALLRLDDLCNALGGEPKILAMRLVARHSARLGPLAQAAR